jgi:hypothetical protein
LNKQNLKPVTFESYGEKSWVRPNNYNFSKGDVIAALGATEITKTMMGTAVAFVPENENFIPVAVQGINQGHNLMVDQNGKWREGYVPAIYRSYPFRLASNEDGIHFLCVDENSGLVKNNKSGFEPFFEDSNKLSEHTIKAFQLLVDIERDRLLSVKICKALNYAGVIEPWPLTIETKGEKKEIMGLFRICEEKMNCLEPDIFAELREGGALLLAYCQLLSMQHIQKLGQLSWQEAKASEVQNMPRTSDFSLGTESGTLSFENL